jgi:hypothetical protein
MNAPDSHQYRVDVIRTDDGAVFPGALLPPAYLQVGRDEAIFRAQRRGVVGADPTGVEVSAEPIFQTGSEQVCGARFTIESGGQRIEHEYGIDLFAPAAEVVADRLAKSGHLKTDAKYAYRVSAHPVASTHSARPEGVTVTVRRAPLPLVPGRLADWLSRARPSGPPAGADYPLFITPRALERMRQFSRKPGDREGGALLVGRLLKQEEPESEIFGVVDDALEARHAENEPLSLDLTAKTWSDFDTQLTRRRSRLGRRHEVALGFAHGHNFLPEVKDDGQPRCGECAVKDSCPFSSSFYSTRDAEFHRALFGRQPYAVGLVWGYTTKREDDLRAYCLRGGVARRRGFYELDSEPEGLA